MMNLLLSDAWADGPAPAAGLTSPGGLMSFLPLVVIFVIFYFLLIRPQSKRAKEHKAMVDAVAKGDEVVTNGGIMGRVTHVSEGILTIEIADGVQVKLQRHAVASVLPKGTLKSA
jgi:preprotein translocase subunit YajC